MRVIDLRKDNPRITALSYGASRSGKTHFAATWPDPLFLSDAREGGWETIRTMDPAYFYDAEPQVWALDDPSDLIKALSTVKTQLQKHPGMFKTLVVDSLTLYSDFFYSRMLAEANRSPGKLDTRKLYGNLWQHISWVQDLAHDLPLHVLWLCLEKPVSDDNPEGMPLLTGQAALKVPAKVNYVFYHRIFRDPDGDPIYEVRTKYFQKHFVGGRCSDLPDPLPEPEFHSLETALTRGPKHQQQEQPKQKAGRSGK